MNHLLLATLLALIVLSANASAPVPEKDSAARDDETTTTTTTTTASKQRKARFVHKTIIIPHDDKKFRGGEDAASTTDSMIVVADGVGGWANRGVNPGLYSRKLTETITSRFEEAISQTEDPVVDLKKLVHESNHIAASQHLGSATCTVVRLKDATTLETLNVGDSTYSIHRRVPKGDKSDVSELEVIYAAEPGQKGFNFPYQLGGQHGDQVYDAGAADGPRLHTLQEKDVIIVVSDGINDNLHPNEYHECIQSYQWTPRYQSPTAKLFEETYKGYYDEDEIVSYSAVADCIARKAYFLGKDRSYYSPFAQSAAEYGKRYIGGKHDDITVTVAQVEMAAYDSLQGAEVFSVNLTEDDPYKTESIFLYTDDDGPIPPLHELPDMDSLLKTLLSEIEADAEASTVATEL